MSTSFFFLCGGLFFTGFIAAAICYILSVVGLWRLFAKAGEKGWKSLIPFYNLYIQFKFSWKTVLFWPYLAIGLGYNFFFQSLSNSNSEIFGFILGFVYLIAMIFVNYNLARSFGRGRAFTVGLILLEPIFIIILGFGDAKYIGPMGIPKGNCQTPAA